MKEAEKGKKYSTGDGKSGRKHKDGKRKTESGRRREVVGVGGYQGQEQLRSPTPAVPSQGKQQGSRWAISGMILAASTTADQQRRTAREVGGGPNTGSTCSTLKDAMWKS